MKPIRTLNTNTVFKLPGGTEDNDLPLSRIRHEDNTVTMCSTWELTDEERVAIANGACIELYVWGEGHPPVTLAISSGDILISGDLKLVDET